MNSIPATAATTLDVTWPDLALVRPPRLLFAELLDRKVGPDAARAFLGPLPDGLATGDDLLDRVAARVRKRLGPSP